jgi:hypothetical protein
MYPCGWGFGFFSPGVLAVSLTEGYAGNSISCRVLVVVQNTSFLPSVRELGFLLFGKAAATLLQSQ